MPEAVESEIAILKVQLTLMRESMDRLRASQQLVVDAIGVNRLKDAEEHNDLRITVVRLEGKIDLLTTEKDQLERDRNSLEKKLTELEKLFNEANDRMWKQIDGLKNQRWVWQGVSTILVVVLTWFLARGGKI